MSKNKEIVIDPVRLIYVKCSSGPNITKSGPKIILELLSL